MTRRTMLGLLLTTGLLGLAFGATAQAAARADADATGTWTWTFQRPNGGDSVTITMKLKQDGDKLTGTISRPGSDETTEIKDGKVSGDEVSFKVVRERDGNTFTIKYQGKLSGDTITGKSEMETSDGQTRSRDWEAKRAS